MQRLCTNLRLVAMQSSRSQALPVLSPSLRPLHHSSPWFGFSPSKWSFRSFLNNASTPHDSSASLALASFRSPSFSPPLLQVRHVSSRERAKRRKPMTPRTSKLKKIKMKYYSSYKDRFRTMSDGKIRRWREGKNHNAHLKSRKSRQRLRQPAIVPAAYAKVMKKLNFCA